MTSSFRLCLTRDPANRVPLPEPATYDPARFELARRALAAGGHVGFHLYPLPGGKFDGNNSIGGQISLGLIGGGNRWHAADEDERRAIWYAHTQYTLEFLHFLRTDPAVPEKIRKQYAGLGLCRDEFPDTGHFPPAIYVRESRRMKGVYVMSQKDIIDTPEKDDPIAIFSFPIDSHDWSYDRKLCPVEGKEKGGVSCCDLFTNSSPRWAERIRHHARFYGSRFELSIRSQTRPETGPTGSDRVVSE